MQANIKITSGEAVANLTQVLNGAVSKGLFTDANSVTVALASLQYLAAIAQNFEDTQGAAPVVPLKEKDGK